jgi:hypothetical protein
MSFYIAAILPAQAILAYDRARVTFEKENGKIRRRRMPGDILSPKFSKINEFTYFAGPANSILDEDLSRFLRKYFGQERLNLERLERDRPLIQEVGRAIIGKVSIESDAYFESIGIKKDQIDFPAFRKLECLLAGVDTVGKPYLISFLDDDFDFSIYLDPGTVIVVRIAQLEASLGGMIRPLCELISKKQGLPSTLATITTWTFSKIMRYVAKHDPDISAEFDLIVIDENGSAVSYKGG